MTRVITIEEDCVSSLLKSNSDLAIPGADKENATVVMNRHDYDANIFHLVSDSSSYKLLKKIVRCQSSRTSTIPMSSAVWFYTF